MSKSCQHYLFIALFLIVGALNPFNNAQAKHLLVFGDSLSAAYGMELDQGWVSLLAKQLADEHMVTNASVSGETTIGGLSRLPAVLNEYKPDLVLLELGANDGLQGFAASRIRSNLAKMVDMIIASGAQPIIAGINIPANYGPRYIDQFRSLFSDLAKEKSVPYIDLYLQEIALNPDYLQTDGIHPSANSQPLVRDHIAEFLSEQGLLQ